VTRVDLPAASQRRAHLTATRGRDFHHGVRLLPRPKRSSLCAVYAATSLMGARR
jgi:phytoene/squalene synthetase